MESSLAIPRTIAMSLLASILLASPTAGADNILLESLQGCWQGEAVKTPRGPLPYPICFKLHEGNELYGVTDLNVSQHHWRFHLDGQASRLNFLSTFAGNQTPIELSTINFKSDSLTFATDNKNFLQVEVLRLDKEYRFTIQKRGKEHVIIRLIRQEE